MIKNVIRKLFRFSLCIALCVSLMPAAAFAIALPDEPLPEETVDHTVDEDYVPAEEFIQSIEVKTEVPDGYIGIYSATELLGINDDPTANYILMKDVDMTAFCESGHGAIYYFQGIFDGNGHTVYGMKQQVTPQRYDSSTMGLFFRLLGGTVKNLKVSGTYTIYSFEDKSTLYAGGIAGRVTEGSTITNCVSEVTIDFLESDISSASLGMNAYIGGIAGIVYSENEQSPAEISYCAYAGEEIDGYGYVGGILGRCSLGGLKIASCLNKGHISGLADADASVGGIIGSVGEKTALSGEPVTVSECANYGRVESGWNAGGIIGLADCPADRVIAQITDCMNGGPVFAVYSADSAAGGCIGRLNWGNTVEMDRFLSEADLSAGLVGAFCGNIADGAEPVWENCYYTEEAPAQAFSSETGEMEKHSECLLTGEALLKEESFDGFDFSTVWKLDEEWHEKWFYQEEPTDVCLRSLADMKPGFIWPTVSMRVSTLYYYSGAHKENSYGSHGPGYPIDIPGKAADPEKGTPGDPIYAVADGEVIRVDMLETSYGHSVRIQHADGTVTLYGHMDEVFVTVGDKVKQGDQIGTMGSTGNSTGTHLHFAWLGGNAWETYYKELHLTYDSSVYNANKYWAEDVSDDEKDEHSVLFMEWLREHYTCVKGVYVWSK